MPNNERNAITEILQNQHRLIEAKLMPTMQRNQPIAGDPFGIGGSAGATYGIGTIPTQALANLAVLPVPNARQVKVNPGYYYDLSSPNPIIVPGVTFTIPPNTGDVIGYIYAVSGQIMLNTSISAFPYQVVPLAKIFLESLATFITAENIIDSRPFLRMTPPSTGARTMTTQYSITADARPIIFADATYGNLGVTIPIPSVALSPTYTIKKLDASSHYVFIISSVTIDLQASIILYEAFSSITIENDGYQWLIV